MPNDNRRSSEQNNGLHCTCFAEKRFFKWKEDERSVSLRAKFGSYGGGSEVLVKQSWDGTQVASTLSANNAGGQQRMPDKQNFNAVIEKDESESVVRRLTPLETERLQAMPDNWSKYGVDESGEVYELSDTARYKLQGNGIATPFWRFLMKRISAQYERTPTLGSLFDGQGSFPMIWEGINGPGTALWSSEIDKHATAVAKYHFPEGGENAENKI